MACLDRLERLFALEDVPFRVTRHSPAYTAQDVANGVLFLASDASQHVTGSEMVIDGGIMAGNVPRPAT